MATSNEIPNVLRSERDVRKNNGVRRDNEEVNNVERKGEAELGPIPDVEESSWLHSQEWPGVFAGGGKTLTDNTSTLPGGNVDQQPTS